MRARVAICGGMLLAITGCASTHPVAFSPAPGEAWVASGPMADHVPARLGRETIGEEEYEAVVLDLAAGSLKILSERFRPGRFSFPAPPDAPRTLVVLMTGTRAYMIERGSLLVQRVSRTRVRGRFDFELHDALASCMYCPETWLTLRGEFDAVTKQP